MRLIEQALDMVEEGTEDYARLNSALGASAGMLGNGALSREAFRRAEDTAQKLGLRRLEMETFFYAQTVTMFHRQFEESLQLGDRAIALAAELDVPVMEGNAHFFAGGASFYLGRFAMGTKHSEETTRLAMRTRQPYQIASGSTARAVMASGRGDWIGSKSVLAQGFEAQPFDARLNAQAALAAYHSGDLEQADHFAHRVAEITASIPPGPDVEHTYATTLPARGAHITGRPPDAAAVRASARGVLESPVPRTPLFRAMVHVALATVASMTNDRAAAEELLPIIEAQGAWFPDYHVHSDHVRGLLLETLSRMDDAVDAMEAALAWLPAEYRPIRAEAAYDCARLRLKRGAPGDHERARALIDESLAEAQALGMKPLVERILR